MHNAEKRSKIALLGLDLTALEELAAAAGQPKYRALQLFAALHAGKSPAEISTLPKSFRLLLETGYLLGGAEIYRKYTSKIDGTVKYLYRFADGELVEGVRMQYKHGATLCVSTQVGCRMGCVFCTSGENGLLRNLAPGEMLGQILAANLDYPGAPIHNLVLMGSGEPLDNYENVLQFIRLATHEKGLNISRRSISVSTCGLVPKMRALADENLGVNLSVSLHAPFDDVRARMMPIAKSYTVKETVEAARYFVEKTGRRVIFEYALAAGENDTPPCASELARLLRGFQNHINLIPLNKTNDKLTGASRASAAQFAKMLTNLHLSCTIRRELGTDISGACGQLRGKVKEEASDGFLRQNGKGLGAPE